MAAKRKATEQEQAIDLSPLPMNQTMTDHEEKAHFTAEKMLLMQETAKRLYGDEYKFRIIGFIAVVKEFKRRHNETTVQSGLRLMRLVRDRTTDGSERALAIMKISAAIMEIEAGNI